MSFKVSTKVKVRFADIDSMGHVNNAKFFTYMEQARVEYFRKIKDLDFRTQEGAPGTSVILASIRCDFLAPVYLDEELSVSVRTTKMGRSSFSMEYLIQDTASGREVGRGESTQVYFDYQNEKSLEIPDSLRKKFAEIEGEEF